MSYSRTAQARRAVMSFGYLSASSIALLSSQPARAGDDAQSVTLPAVTVDVGSQSGPSKTAAKKPAARRPDKFAHAKSKSRVAKTATIAMQVSDPEAGDAGPVDASFGSTSGARGLNQIPQIGKTGTPIGNLPGSVQVINRKVLNEQGAISVREAITNASGINEGGSDSFGYYDRFLIRGLNAQIYSDGFSDGDQTGGVPHSLNGVQGIEIQEGPGSALFGSGPPGGTINIVHYQPSPEFHYGDSFQVGSFGTVTNNVYVTGPSTVPGLDYRIDATATRTDGFRDAAHRDYEVRPAFTWHVGDHTIGFALDARRIEDNPDAMGLLYVNGAPIKGVSTETKYSSPFSFANQDFIRPTLTDKWVINDFLTINNRFSYLYRSIDFLRNPATTRTFVCTDPATQKDPVTGAACIQNEVVGRQLRQQTDTDNNLDYQLEPVWRFAIGDIGHTLLTGFEYQHQTLSTSRRTADLANIANAFDPVIPETSPAGLTFKCDQSHSCDDDHLAADYFSLYATDQIDVTDKLKVRAGIRQDWWETSLTPQITVPGSFTPEGTPLIAGETENRNDMPVSWNAGVLYKLFPGVSPYFGASQSHLANFSSESVQNGVGPPESALQYEAGIKFSAFNDRVILNTAAFQVSRDNVAALLAINGDEVTVFDSQRTEGVEASLDAKLTDQWHLMANFTAQDAIITDNPQNVNALGNHPQGVPAYIANLWTTYGFSIAGIHGFQVGAGLNYRDKTFSDITNVNAVPSYIIGNAMVGYEAERWGVTVNVDNLTDERYFVAANGASALVGDPLSAFVNVHFKE